ncbi:methionyl-tRNA synthetase [Sorochytrium milnesiophthora]
MRSTTSALRSAGYYVTTPIFYVNSVPHIGHVYSTVLADTLARWARLKGRQAVLSTGTDEHGLKIQQAADRSGMPPQQFCDGISQKFRDIFDQSQVQYTRFIRTSEPQHKKAVAAIWDKLSSAGYIYKDHYEGWYSVSDETFYAASEVHSRRDPKTGSKRMFAKESGQPVEWMSESTYKFRLTAFREQLRKWVTTSGAIKPTERVKDVLAFLQSKDFDDLSVSRPTARVPWGIPVPNDPQHTVYVWLDALTNYLTVAGYPGTPCDGSDAATSIWPPDVQVVGKDIFKFHALYWPAFLMACGLPLPKEILAHAHWTMNRSKMSKSKGNVVDPAAVFAKYGSDAVRFFLMLNGGILDDGDWSESVLQKVYKKELAGQLGNLFSRATSAGLNPRGIVPQPDLSNLDDYDHMFRKVMNTTAAQMDSHMEQREFNKALTCVVDMVAQANKYFTNNTPWALPPDSTRLSTVLYHSLECSRLAGILLQPVMPGKAGQLLDMLSVDASQRLLVNAEVGAGWTGSDSAPVQRGVLFPKIASDP